MLENFTTWLLNHKEISKILSSGIVAVSYLVRIRNKQRSKRFKETWTRKRKQSYKVSRSPLRTSLRNRKKIKTVWETVGTSRKLACKSFDQDHNVNHRKTVLWASGNHASTVSCPFRQNSTPKIILRLSCRKFPKIAAFSTGFFCVRLFNKAD